MINQTSRFNDLDSFFIKNNQQPTPKRNSTNKTNLPVQPFPNNKHIRSTSHSQNKENSASYNHLQNKQHQISRRTDVSPQKVSKRPPSYHPVQPKTKIDMINQKNPCRQSDHNIRFCQNHENKISQYHILIDEENLYYCQKCATKLASQGFPVKKIGEQNECKSQQKEKCYFEGNPFYEELKNLLENLYQTREKIENCIDQSRVVDTLINEAVTQAQSYYSALRQMIEAEKETVISHIFSLREKYQSCQFYGPLLLQQDLHEVIGMKEDIEANLEEIMKDVQETSFKQCVDGYREKINEVDLKIKDRGNKIKGLNDLTAMFTDESIDEITAVLDKIKQSLVQCNKMTTQKSQRNQSMNKVCLEVKEQISLNSNESSSRGPFRNLFESEQSRVKRPLIGKR